MSIVPDKKLEKKIILIVVILAAIAIPILGRFREAKSIPVFAIYPSADRADRAPSSIDKIQLLSQPLITDSDILEYRWTSHELLLTENAKKKLQSIEKKRKIIQIEHLLGFNLQLHERIFGNYDKMIDKILQ